ncbi:MAG: rod shape-determining protein MreD [Gammaproteobacteria bacterium]|nr:rod shape-determining protein MreD [Gammaproteobacteria bacterium]
MKQHPFKMRLLIYISLFLTMVLAILPWPKHIGAWQSVWLIIMVFYWSLNAPQIFSVGSAFIVGLLLDSLFGSPLGLHAIPLVMMCYILCKIAPHFRFFSHVQKLTLITLLTASYVLLITLLQNLLNIAISSIFAWLLVVVTTLAWWPISACFSGFIKK